MSLFLFLCILLPFLISSVPFLGRLCLDKERHATLTGEEDCGDFPSAFLFVFRLFFSPPETADEHADEHSLRPHHVTLHVVVVVAGSGISTPHVSDMGEMKDNS